MRMRRQQRGRRAQQHHAPELSAPTTPSLVCGARVHLQASSGEPNERMATMEELQALKALPGQTALKTGAPKVIFHRPPAPRAADESNSWNRTAADRRACRCR